MGGDAGGFGGSVAITPNWHHFALAFDGGATSLYLDGALVVPPVAAGAAVYAQDPLHIGCDLNFGLEASLFVGLIDDVRLYDHVLTASEIAALAAM